MDSLKKKVLEKNERPLKISSEEKHVRRVTWIGLWGNLLLSGFKFFCGLAGHSQALIADAIHSLSDVVTDMAVIGGSYFWSAPPDQCHPHGHRRIETMVTLAIGTILLGAGIGIGLHAIQTIHHTEGGRPGGIALLAAGFSLVFKEILFRWTRREGRQIHSPALIANAWHHRLDAISSIPVFLAVGGTILFPWLTFLDHIGALVVSIFILQAACRILWPGIEELMEKGADPDTVSRIKSLAAQDPEVLDIHALRTRYIGNRLRLDFHLVVDGQITIRQGHDIAERIKAVLLREVPGLEDAIIHIEPAKPDTQA